MKTEAYIEFDQDAINRDEAPWSLTIPSPDGKPYSRRSWSPEPLLRVALKWGRDRNQRLTVIVWDGPKEDL